MKIGIISDIHANIYALRSVLEKLESVDLILCAGDITGYYPFVNEVFEELNRYSVIFIKGNHDAFLCGDRIKDLSPIESKSLQYTRNHITTINLGKLRNAHVHQELTIEGCKIVMFHGSPWDNLEQYIYPNYSNFKKFAEIDADLIILGHTHYPLVRQVGKKLIINPGSCGQPRDYDPRASFAVLDTSTKEADIERIEYNIEKVCQEVSKLGFDNKLNTILTRTR